MSDISQIEREVDLIAEMIKDSTYLVVFTGAGISTESGLSDFRGKDGIWTRKEKGLPPKHGKHFDEVKPNEAHYAIKELQDMKLMKFLISQNVDNLHLESGIEPSLIAELHGNYKLMKCIDCDARYTSVELRWDRELHGRGFRTEPQQANQPVCLECGGRIISSIVNFNDPMPEKEMKISKEHAVKCDLILVIGSSLSVQPASNFPRKAKKNEAKLIIINIDTTTQDDLADIRVTQKAGNILPQIVEKLKKLL
ncbi:MAG: SIR2 family NAD-dependent protein deacylase [Candidatus Heimdallarchaeaceae archaeon]